MKRRVSLMLALSVSFAAGLIVGEATRWKWHNRQTRLFAMACTRQNSILRKEESHTPPLGDGARPKHAHRSWPDIGWAIVRRVKRHSAE